MTNPELRATIRALRARSRGGAPLWRALAEELEASKRRRVAVNLSTINRHSREGEVVAVPGKVLGSGALAHPVTVAAFAFSEAARQKIARAEGRALSLREFASGGAEPSTVRILK